MTLEWGLHKGTDGCWGDGLVENPTVNTDRKSGWLHTRPEPWHSHTGQDVAGSACHHDDILPLRAYHEPVRDLELATNGKWKEIS